MQSRNPKNVVETYARMEGHVAALRELTQAPYAASFGELRRLRDDRHKLYRSYGAVDYTALFVQLEADVIAAADAAAVEVEKTYREARTALDAIVEKERDTLMFNIEEPSGRRRKMHLLRAIRVRVPAEFIKDFKEGFTARYGAELAYAAIDDERVAANLDARYKRLMKYALYMQCDTDTEEVDEDEEQVEKRARHA